MKRIISIVVILMMVSISAYAAQKINNITEDTLSEDSYRPVGGKDFLVAVKLVDVDANNLEQPVSTQIIQFQTSAGTLSETEVKTNFYGEAITWLKTDIDPDKDHTITAKVKDNNNITPISITVRNAILPEGGPTAEELAQQVDNNASKVQDYKADIYMTSNATWTTPEKQLKIWTKGNKYKVQEISPTPEISIRPEISVTPPTLIKDLVAYNKTKTIYKIQNKEASQQDRYPIEYIYVDSSKGIIVKKGSLLKNEGELHLFVSENTDFIDSGGIWIFQKAIETGYSSLSTISYTNTYQYSNIQVNTGIPDTEFVQ